MLKTHLKAISMFTELEEEQAAPRTKIDPVTYVTGEFLISQEVDFFLQKSCVTFPFSLNDSDRCRH